MHFIKDFFRVILLRSYNFIIQVYLYHPALIPLVPLPSLSSRSLDTMSNHSSIGVQKTDDVVGDSESASIATTDALQLVIHSSTTEGNDLAGNDAYGITELIGNVDDKLDGCGYPYC